MKISLHVHIHIKIIPWKLRILNPGSSRKVCETFIYKHIEIKNEKFSGYYFYMNLNIYGDFQICISVPLNVDDYPFAFCGFLRPDLSPWRYKNRCFSGCTVPPDSKETELGSSDQEAPPSAGKNTGVVLVPCHSWKCVHAAIFGGVDISKISGCHLL